MIAEIAGAVASIKSAIEIAKALATAGKEVELATVKLQAAELMTKLAEVQVALLSANGAVDERDSEITRLAEALEMKSKVVKAGDAYYDLDDNGQPTGAPYCMRCWEADHRLLHITLAARVHDDVLCPHCRTAYSGEQIPIRR